MESKKILITGGTGFIGSYLAGQLLKQGHFLTVITRSPSRYNEEQAKNMQYVGWDDDLIDIVNRCDIIINLAGESLFGQRWTDDVKSSIYDSRIVTTQKLVSLIAEAENKPELLISASAVGIYGDRGDMILDESSSLGDDFLADVCKDWEKEAIKASDYGVRVAIPRIGVVLEENGGMIEKMLLPFKLFLGGPIGSGTQYIPWVHMSDLCNAILFPIEKSDLTGPFNVCSPEPQSMAKLADALANVLNRPSFFKVPESLLKLVLGEAAQPVLGSLRVQPKVLQVSDFVFEFEDLEEALADIL